AKPFQQSLASKALPVTARSLLLTGRAIAYALGGAWASASSFEMTASRSPQDEAERQLCC
ncbi:hypothetical protein, partial [Bradyrhizobium ottawaense]|uniref:hypothetical protein n=1 Tax=Bradyrhizobium ottawaense TaxID=931866 RepID=UPI0030C705FE